jgi:hypothetical protein
MTAAPVWAVFFLEQLPTWNLSTSWRYTLVLRGSDARLACSDIAANPCANSGQDDGPSCAEASVTLQEPRRLQDVPVSK